MTIGDKIQLHRKKLGLSQDELGQKLLVSRQTVSLWEKNQTIPTIDNLIRLKEIFGVSVDEILNTEEVTQEQETSVSPNESYNFNYSQNEFTEIYRFLKRPFFNKILQHFLIYLALMIILFANSAPKSIIGFCLGVFFVGVISNIKGIRLNKIMWKKSENKVTNNIYEYYVYENYCLINIIKNNEIRRTSKIYFSEIEQIQDIGKYLLLQISGELFILKKSELVNDSAFYAIMNSITATNAVKKTSAHHTGLLYVLSWILFICSLLSILGAITCTGVLGLNNNMFAENMWVFYLFVPIPVASIIFGFISKRKGYKYKLNVTTGIIMTIMLLIYGSFSFIFQDVFDHSEEYVIKIEQTVGIDIPTPEQINTQDWTNGTQSLSKGYIYYVSDIFFDQNSTELFEKQIKSDSRWLSRVPNDMTSIISTFADISNYDYTLVYNVDTKEFNTPPDESGTYRFINILYTIQDDTMEIIEYDIDYVKVNSYEDNIF